MYFLFVEELLISISYCRIIFFFIIFKLLFVKLNKDFIYYFIDGENENFMLVVIEFLYFYF